MIRLTAKLKSFAPVAQLGETSDLCEVYFARGERPKSVILGWGSGDSRVGVARPEGSVNEK
jgi:hypothetical protein